MGIDPNRNPEPMACAVCGTILTRMVQPEGKTEYRHGPNLTEDHPVIVVPARVLRANIRCDFCLEDNCRWTLPCETYAIGGGPDRNVGDWAVCDECAALLQADDWDAITDRVFNHFTVRNKSDGVFVPREAFVQMYDELKPHILGPVYLH